MVVCTYEVSKRLEKIFFKIANPEPGQVWYFDEKEVLILREATELIEKDKFQCVETLTGKRFYASVDEFTGALPAPSFEQLLRHVVSNENIADILAYGLIENEKIKSGF